MTKVVIQASGGIESTTLLALAIKQHGVENVFPIAFNTDSVFWHNRDRTAVMRVIKNLQLQRNLLICNMPQVDMLEYSRDEDYDDVGFIPGFKMMFNIATMAYAQRVGATEVWVGNMTDNVFPDEDAEFIQNTASLYNGCYTPKKPISFIEPFKAMSKSDVINIGHSLIGDALFDTVSCGDERLAGGFNCGICNWCIKRRKGFEVAHIQDKTQYLLLPHLLG